MDEKEIGGLFKKYAKSRITIVKRTVAERRHAKKILRDDGFADVVEYETFDDAWAAMQLKPTHVLVFSIATPEGVMFFDNIIESTRYKKTPLIIFSAKIKEHQKIYSSADIIAEWEEAPINAFKVEQALARVLENGVVEKNQTSTESAALAHYTNAVKALYDDAFDEAKALLRMSLKENPEFLEAYMKMAEALIGLEDYTTAKRVLEKASSLSPDDSRIMLLQAKISAADDTQDEAVILFDKMVEKNNQDTYFIIEIGNIAIGKGWMEDAIRYFEMARESGPDLIHPYNRLGTAHSRAGHFDTALEMYNKALKIDNNDAGIYFNIGMTLCRKEDNQQALENFRKAAKLDSTLTESHKWIEKLENESN